MVWAQYPVECIQCPINHAVTLTTVIAGAPFSTSLSLRWKSTLWWSAATATTLATYINTQINQIFCTLHAYRGRCRRGSCLHGRRGRPCLLNSRLCERPLVILAPQPIPPQLLGRQQGIHCDGVMLWIFKHLLQATSDVSRNMCRYLRACFEHDPVEPHRELHACLEGFDLGAHLYLHLHDVQRRMEVCLSLYAHTTQPSSAVLPGPVMIRWRHR